MSRIPDGDLKAPPDLLQVNVSSPTIVHRRSGGRTLATDRIGTMRVLLIEDDTILGAAVRDQIAAEGHSVDWVTRLDAAHGRRVPEIVSR